MRFCVSCRQNESVLKEAQEIKVEYKDIAFIDNYLEREEKPHVIVLRIPNYTEINWDIMYMYNEKLKGNFILSLDNIKIAPKAKEYNIKFYWNYPIVNYYELNNVIAAGAHQVILGMPLCFEIPHIKEKEIKLRLIPNYAFNDYLLEDDGVCAGWIRPEDLELYEDIAESCEFYADSLQKEKALFHIYQMASWPDDLSLIIKNLNKEFYNQHLNSGFSKARMECGQRCSKNKKICSACERIRKTTVNLKKLKEIENN